MKGLKESIREPLAGYSSEDMEDPLLPKAENSPPPEHGRRRSRSKLLLLLAFFFALPVLLFVSMHAWFPHGPDRHKGHFPGGRMRGPPHGPTPVQCALLSTATPALNISLDPLLHSRPGPHQPPPPPPPPPPPGGHSRPGPRRHRGPPPPPPHFFIDPTLDGAKSITVLRSGPVLPPPKPPKAGEDGKEPARPRPEPIRVEVRIDIPGRDGDLVDVQRIMNHQVNAENKPVKFDEVHICVVSDGPGSLGIAAFPQDPLKGPSPEDDNKESDSDKFAKVINAIAIKMHLPAHFPSATLDLHLGPRPHPPPPPPPPPHHHPHRRPFPCLN